MPQASEGTRAVVVVGGAPIGEEIFFRGIVSPVINALIPIPFLDIPIQAGIFSIFHLKAYSGSFEKQGIGVIGVWSSMKQALTKLNGAFLGALIFGVIAGTLTAMRRSVLPSIIMHAMVNGYLIATVFVIIALSLAIIKRYKIREVKCEQ